MIYFIVKLLTEIHFCLRKFRLAYYSTIDIYVSFRSSTILYMNSGHYEPKKPRIKDFTLGGAGPVPC